MQWTRSRPYPDSTAIYADACGGNQYTFAADGSEPLAACKARGHELAEVVLRIGNGSLEEVTGPIESRLKILDLPLAEPVSHKRALELAQGVPLYAGFQAFPDPRRDTNWIRALLKHYKEGIPFPTRISEYVCTDEEFPRSSTSHGSTRAGLKKCLEPASANSLCWQFKESR